MRGSSHIDRLQQQTAMSEIQRLESIAHERLEAATTGEQYIEKEKMKIVSEKQALEDLQMKAKQSEEKAVKLLQAAQDKHEVYESSTDQQCLLYVICWS